MAVDISVVIPTFNRRRQLERTLAGLATQVQLDADVEVIVVSDGSSDGTDAWLRSGATPVPVLVLSQENSGPAVARNRGAEAASGELLVFLDDDVVPAPDLVSSHLRHHGGGADDTVVIGPMLSPPDAQFSPWVRWEQHMLYKQYDAMNRGDWAATARQFYTGNASLARRHLLASGGFDPAFRRAEDVELAYRLADAGLTFTFAADAIVWHYAERSFESWLANATAYGRNDVIFVRDQGRGWLSDNLSREFRHRHPAVRALTTRLSEQRLAGSYQRTAGGAARAAGHTGPERLADIALSTVYNLEYYQGMAQELGGAQPLLAMFDRQAEPT